MPTGVYSQGESRLQRVRILESEISQSYSVALRITSPPSPPTIKFSKRENYRPRRMDVGLNDSARVVPGTRASNKALKPAHLINRHHCWMCRLQSGSSDRTSPTCIDGTNPFSVHASSAFLLPSMNLRDDSASRRRRSSFHPER
jgi:hypothetical protein